MRMPGPEGNFRGRGGSLGGWLAFHENDRSRRYAIRSRPPWRPTSTLRNARGEPDEDAGRRRSRERRPHIASDQGELAHDVLVRHAWEEETADQVRHSVLLDEGPELLDHLVRPTDEETVLLDGVEVGGDGGVDERMLPAARVLLPVRHHDVPLGERARLTVRLRDDHVSRERPFGERLPEPGRLTIREKPLPPVEQPREIGRGTGDPIVGERGGAPERQLAPAADPDRGVRLRDRLGLERAFDLVVRPLERQPVLGPESLHDRELLLEARATLLEIGAIESELVGFVTDGNAQHRPSPGHDVEKGDVLGESRRMVERRDQDVCPENDLRRPRREPRQHRNRGGPVVIDDRVVLLHPDGIEPKVFGAHDLVEGIAVKVPALDGDEADLEPGHGRWRSSSDAWFSLELARVREHLLEPLTVLGPDGGQWRSHVR